MVEHPFGTMTLFPLIAIVRIGGSMAGWDLGESGEEPQSCSTVELGSALAAWAVRSAVAEAFGAGRLSYCKVRAITRVVDAGPEIDQSPLALAERGTVADLDRAVRHWEALADGGKAGDGGSHEPASLSQRRADALVETVRAGVDGAGVAGSERYTLHLMADIDAVADRLGARAELVDGGPYSDRDAAAAGL